MDKFVAGLLPPREISGARGHFRSGDERAYSRRAVAVFEVLAIAFKVEGVGETSSISLGSAGAATGGWDQKDTTGATDSHLSGTVKAELYTAKFNKVMRIIIVDF